MVWYLEEGIKVFFKYDQLCFERKVTGNQIINEVVADVLKEVGMEDAKDKVQVWKRTQRILLKKEAIFKDYGIQNYETLELRLCVWSERLEY